MPASRTRKTKRTLDFKAREAKIFCVYCGRIGHFLANCETAPKLPKTPKEAVQWLKLNFATEYVNEISDQLIQTRKGFRTLNYEEQSELARTMLQKGDTTVFQGKFFVKIYDLKTLNWTSSSWLSSHVLDVYFELIHNRAKSSTVSSTIKVTSAGTVFTTQLLTNPPSTMAVELNKTIPKFFSYELIFFSI